MQAKHTPGPWTVVGTEVRHLADDETIVEITGYAQMTPRQAANAALIAAAPDMLAALREIVSNHGLRASLLRDGFGPQLDAARAAIRKATGA